METRYSSPIAMHVGSLFWDLEQKKVSDKTTFLSRLLLLPPFPGKNTDPKHFFDDLSPVTSSEKNELNRNRRKQSKLLGKKEGVKRGSMQYKFSFGVARESGFLSLKKNQFV